MSVPETESKKLLDQIHDGEEWRQPHLEVGQRIIAYREERLLAPGVPVSEGAMGLLDVTPDNIMHGFHRTMSANLSVGAPRIAVEPEASQHEQIARDRGARANYNLRANHWNEQLRYWIGNTLDYGWGALLIGYHMPLGGFPGRTTRRHIRTLARDAVGGNGRELPYNRDAADVDEQHPMLWTDQSILPGTVFLKAIRAEDFVGDPKAGDIREADWAAISFWMTLDEVKEWGKVGRFKGELEKVEAYSWHSDTNIATKWSEEINGLVFYQKKAKAAGLPPLAKGWSFWDRRSMHYKVVFENSPIGPVVDEKWPAPRKSFPIHILNFSPRHGRFYGRSELAPAEGSQAQANIFQSRITTHARQNKEVTAYNENEQLEAEHIQRFIDAEPGEFVPVPGNPKEILMQLKFGVDLKEWVATKEMVKQNARVTLGIAAEEVAQQADRESATETAWAARSSQVRTHERKTILRETLQDVYEDYIVWDTLSAYYRPDQARDFAAMLLEPKVFFRGDLGLEPSGRVRRIQGFDAREMRIGLQVRVDATAQLPFEREKQAAAVREFANIWGPMGVVNMWKSAERFAELRDIEYEDLMNERPEVIDATREHVLLLEGQPVTIQPGEDHQKHIRQHMEQLQKIQARANDILTALFLRSPQATQGLVAHIQEYAPIFQNATGRAMEEKALSPIQARRGQPGQRAIEQQGPGTLVPTGQVNQPIGGILEGV